MRSITAWLRGGVFSLEVVDKRPGILVFRASGSGVRQVFSDEAGGHRWQRIPPTERNGRVQTSTVTVAVLQEPTEVQVKLTDRDIECLAVRGSGPGGQHKNVTASAILVRHKPTGLQARCESERSQHQNKASALAVLRARIWEKQQGAADGSRADDRKRQIGSGMRGDKRRTIRTRDNQVVDHVTGRRWTFDNYARGVW